MKFCPQRNLLQRIIIKRMEKSGKRKRKSLASPEISHQSLLDMFLIAALRDLVMQYSCVLLISVQQTETSVKGLLQKDGIWYQNDQGIWNPIEHVQASIPSGIMHSGWTEHDGSLTRKLCYEPTQKHEITLSRDACRIKYYHNNKVRIEEYRSPHKKFHFDQAFIARDGTTIISGCGPHDAYCETLNGFFVAWPCGSGVVATNRAPPEWRAWGCLGRFIVSFQTSHDAVLLLNLIDIRTSVTQTVSLDVPGTDISGLLLCVEPNLIFIAKNAKIYKFLLVEPEGNTELLLPFPFSGFQPGQV